MDVDVSRLLALESRGFCWTVGSTRIFPIEVRVWPRLQRHRQPVVIVTGRDFAEAVSAAVEAIGDRTPTE